MSEISSAEQQKLDFMTLLVTELQNQNPLDPMDNQDFAAQLAQFTQLELTEEMNGNLETINETIEGMGTSLDGAILNSQLNYARSLLGSEVSFYSEDYQQNLTGTVSGIQFVDGEPVLDVTVTTVNSDSSTSEETIQVALDEIESINL